MSEPTFAEIINYEKKKWIKDAFPEKKEETKPIRKPRKPKTEAPKESE
jgi:hypothetical protein